MRVNLDSQTWRAIDPEAVGNTEGGIQHGASIVQNLRAIGEDALHLLPDRIVLGPLSAVKHGNTFWDGLFSFVIGALWDVCDVITFPFMVLKNLGDMTTHGVAWISNRIHGRSDGTALPVEPFSIYDSGSGARFTWGYNRRGDDRNDDLRPLQDLQTAENHFHDINSAPFTVAQNQSFQNFNGARTWKAQRVYTPGPSLDDLSATMRDIQQKMPHAKIKPGGSSHSFGANASNGVYIKPDGMKFLQKIPAANAAGDDFRADVENRDALVRIGAGVRIRQANPALWALGRAFPVLGGYDGQTMAGALATGTHGAVLGQGPLTSLVRSLDMVLIGGSQVRYEPKNGPTDPEKFRREHPNMRLVQDDDQFNAAVLSCGMMGVVHSLVLETVPRFYLQEHHTPLSFEDKVDATGKRTLGLKSLLQNGNIYNLVQNSGAPEWATKSGPALPDQAKNLYGLSATMNPYTGDVQISGTTTFALDKEPFDLGRRVDRQLLNAIPRGEYARPIADNWLLNQFPILTSAVMNGAAAIAPGAIPGIDEAAVSGGFTYRNRSYNVFFSGDYTADTPAKFCELAVPLRNDYFLKAFPIIQDLLKEWAKTHKQYLTGPVNLRFTKGTPALLARNEDYATFEFLFSGAPAYADAMMNFVRQGLQDRLGKDVVSMHFGQQAPGVTADQLRAQFPGYDRFMRIAGNADPERLLINEAQEPLFVAAPVVKTRGVAGALAAPKISAK